MGYLIKNGIKYLGGLITKKQVTDALGYTPAEEGGSLSQSQVTNALGFTPDTSTVVKQKITGEIDTYITGGAVHSGSAGYIKIASIKVLNSYVDVPVVFHIIQRGVDPCWLWVRFNGANNTEPGIANLKYLGATAGAYVNANGSVYDVWIKKSESYDDIRVKKVVKSEYVNSRIEITYPNTFSAELPTTGTTTTASQATSTYSNATTSANGLMSSTDKAKVDRLGGAISVTVTTTWTGSAAPFSQTISNSSITAGNYILASALAANTTAANAATYNKNFGYITSGSATTAAGSVTFQVYTKPSANTAVKLIAI